MSESGETSSDDNIGDTLDSNSNNSTGFGDNNSNDSSSTKGYNTFANDGSFLEQFKRRMEEAKNKPRTVKENSENSTEYSFQQGDGHNLVATSSQNTKNETENKKPVYPLVGKRRGGKILKTGMVKKQKVEENETEPKDAWSRYMAEVKQYKKHACEEDGKTRPLVK